MRGLMKYLDIAKQIRISRTPSSLLSYHSEKAEAEGGCGVIGIASSSPVAGKHLLQSLAQMRNRGNGKGGGVALVGLESDEFGIDQSTLDQAYFLVIAYLDQSAQNEVESKYIEPLFEIAHIHEFPLDQLDTLPTRAPFVIGYFVYVRPEKRKDFAERWNLAKLEENALDDEIVYQNSVQLNKSFYASLGDKRAFVLSHGKDLLALKLVGYGDDVLRVYGLEDVHANVLIGHHRYPTKGRVWHPGGAHPFVGMHEALVHNGDFANYASVCAYLAQHNIEPLFLTDTEVSVQMFDLLHRVFGYPLEYVIEAMAPTTERDFSLLPPKKQAIYRHLQAAHIHGSPDGPWFFLIAQSGENGAAPREARLIGITDTSMLRPQVFALQQGELGMPSIGFAASEKQAIDAALESLTREDDRFWNTPDLVWNARGGSHTDGGAFIFRVIRTGEGTTELVCQDKFGAKIELEKASKPYRRNGSSREFELASYGSEPEIDEIHQWVKNNLQDLSYADIEYLLKQSVDGAGDHDELLTTLDVLTKLLDGRYPTPDKRRSSLQSIYDTQLSRWLKRVQGLNLISLPFIDASTVIGNLQANGSHVVVDARKFAPDGPNSLALRLQVLRSLGFDHLIIVRARGHRFIGNGFGSDSTGTRIDVYGSPGDYLASGLDGAEIVVHGYGQDQLAQIMKSGKLIVHGDVGQTFMYGAKGGEAYVLGNAAGRPLINAVGKPKVVINGTCLDYLAESFMAGDPLNGGGIIVLNGIRFTEGEISPLDTPYPGGNLFSLASGGAICVRDPHSRLGEDQLNGGRFIKFDNRYWDIVQPLLEENEKIFGISLSNLLQVDGKSREPSSVYRFIIPAGHEALQPEEAWVRH